MPRALAFRCRRRRGRGAGSQPFTNFTGRSPRPRAPPRGGITPCNSLSSAPPCGLIGNLRGREGAGARRARGTRGVRGGAGLSRVRGAWLPPRKQRVNTFRYSRPHLYLPLLPQSPAPAALTQPGGAAWREAQTAHHGEPRVPARRRWEPGTSALSFPSSHPAVRQAEEENQWTAGRRRLLRGRRPASRPHALHPQPPPHLCRNPRAPRGGAAVTSLHKPWQRLAAGEGGGRRRLWSCAQDQE